MAADPQIVPTRSDPDLRAGNEFLGGPAGEHRTAPRFWSPLRVILVAGTVVYWLGLLRTYPCMSNGWADPDRYEALCYSDIPVLYQLRGVADGYMPILDWPADGQPLEYPALTAVYLWLVAKAGALVSTTPLSYYLITAAVSFALFLVAVSATTLTVRSRPWDGLMFAVAPSVFLVSFINWDWLAVAFAALALLAWSRGSPTWAGVALGLGAAAKFYPLLLLGPLLLLCWRARKLGDFVRLLVAAAGAWLAVNLPFMLANPEGWSYFFRFSMERGRDFGSVWLALESVGLTLPPEQVNMLASGILALLCLGIAALILFARVKPRVAQVSFLVVAAFVLTNKVYSPQFVLWLVPLAVLARPRWRDFMWWQAAEAIYFAAIWWHLVGLSGGDSGLSSQWYAGAIAVHVVATTWLAAVVVRDILWPRHDPVRSDAADLSRDPGGGVLEESREQSRPPHPDPAAA